METNTRRIQLKKAFLVCLAVFGTTPLYSAIDPTTQHLVTPGDFEYLGSFRLPEGPVGGSVFAYGGTALAFNPARGSLFLVGHDWQQQVAEVTIPDPALGPLSGLPTAAVLQPFTDATEGRFSLIGLSTNKVGGLLPYEGKLYQTVYRYYDGDGDARLSHFVSGLDLSGSGDVQGPYAVGNEGAGFYAGYFGLIPLEWQSLLGGPVLNGQCCLPVITRTSWGPAAFVIDPSQLGAINPLPSIPLVYYPDSHPLGPYDGQYNQNGWLFNASTMMGGVAFPQGTRSVLFFGRQGLGPYCYGEAVDCGDTVVSSKGPHLPPYVPQVWAYDANDLMLVKQGQLQPWDVRPYATWTPNISFLSTDAEILGVAYDPATSRIFLSVSHGDGDNPLINVYKVHTDSLPLACDVNIDGFMNVVDLQLAINQAKGNPPCRPAGQAGSGDINQDGRCDDRDVQRLVNAGITGTCVAP